MKALKEKINAEEFYRRFGDEPVTKILTVETSGIATALYPGYGNICWL